MINKRCQLSEEARKRGMKMSRLMNMQPAKYVGKVIGETGDGKCWLVLWDGLNNSRPLEKALIEPEDDNG